LKGRIETKSACKKTIKSVQGKIKEVKEKILLLQNVQKSLETLEERCMNNLTGKGCPILKSLSEGGCNVGN
jgi:hypothetical protein